MAGKKSLIIVESPTKAKTIQKYVGDKYVVTASVGHIKDLPVNKLGVDVHNDFEPKYEIIKGKEKIVEEIKRQAKSAKSIYLASDPDREGEAIAWHIAEIIGDKANKINRVLFHEITKKSVEEGLANPTKLNRALYEAQKARRVLDRLVGYQICPILWQKVKRGLSAGRVQSVALRLICEREEQIKSFISEEYWVIDVITKLDSGQELKLRLREINGEKVKLSSKSEAEKVAAEIMGQMLTITEVEKKEVQRRPSPPFITSTLQQEAARHFRFPAAKTMLLAQRLYEGVELPELGAIGLITYMRTDSVRVNEAAIKDARELIANLFGKEYVPPKPHVYKNKRLAQDAHEAIRPTTLELTPEKLQGQIERDLYLLYQLIWNRFIASQMANARCQQLSIKATCLNGKYLFSAEFEEIVFPGFKKIYEERVDQDEEKPEEPEIISKFPDVKPEQQLPIISVIPQQKFTQPPPRYTESSLVKELERKGIGRPSTYATIVSTLKDKLYVVKEKGYFKPTDLGITVTRLLIEHFPEIMDVKFTASMESELDKVEENQVEWTTLLRNFYSLFERRVKNAQERMRNVKLDQTHTTIKCEKCGANMIIRWGKKGKFLACPNFPRCRNTKEYIASASGDIKVVEEIETDEVCEKCGRKLVVRVSKRGKFLACPGYPACLNSKPLAFNLKCPRAGCKGNIVERRSRRSGNPYYVCTRYPDCDFLVWDFPVKRTCPKCGGSFLLLSRDGEDRYLVCPYQECDYKEKIS